MSKTKATLIFESRAPCAMTRNIVMIRRTKNQNRMVKSLELSIASFALVALLAAEWVLVSAIHGTNYDGADGKMAQATILAAVKFSGFFQVTTISPIEGVGSQLLPMNVWTNPAYWPFHFFDKAVASDVSALVALAVFAISCYMMVRCFENWRSLRASSITLRRSETPAETALSATK